jgi:hypothetical protein
MAYRIQSRKRAKQEKETYVNDYDVQFKAAFESWLVDLAKAAEKKDQSLSSIDATELFEIFSNDVQSGAWTRAWRRWQQSPWKEKALALWVVISKRSPPWQFRAAAKVFSVLDGVFSTEVHVLYEVDHINKVIIITKYSGLPGQWEA